MPFFIFDLLSSTPFAADKQRHAWPRPLRNHIARTSLRPGGNKNGLSAVFGSSFPFRQNVLRKIKPKMLRELRRHRICHHFCCWSAPATPVSEEAAETIWRRKHSVNVVSKHIQFLRFSCIFTHYFSRDGKVSCILATISDWFPNIKI